LALQKLATAEGQQDLRRIRQTIVDNETKNTRGFRLSLQLPTIQPPPSFCYTTRFSYTVQTLSSDYRLLLLLLLLSHNQVSLPPDGRRMSGHSRA
jgi:hypothetical protein